MGVMMMPGPVLGPLGAAGVLVPPAQPVLAGLLAWYKLDEGSGTTVRDSSGNGYDGTFGGTAPTWAGGGLTFGSGATVSVPVPVAQVKTFACVIVPPGVTTQLVILGNDDVHGWTAWVMGDTFPNTNKGFVQTTFVNVSQLTKAYAPVFGPAQLTWVTDGTRDRDYINADESGAYVVDGNTAASGRVGNLLLGGAPPYGTYFTGGVLVWAGFWSTALSAADVAKNYTYSQALATARGLALPWVNPGTTRVLVAVGDSITFGVGVTTAWPSALGLAHSYTVYNCGLSGWCVLHASNATANITDSWPTLYAAPYAPAAPVNVAVFFAGTNDAGNGATAAATFAGLQGLVTSALAQGFKVVVVPMLSRTGQDAFKNSYNALIAGASWASGVSVVATSALPHLVPDGSYSNATYFQGDQIHPTQAGQNEIAAAVGPLIDALG